MRLCMWWFSKRNLDVAQCRKYDIYFFLMPHVFNEAGHGFSTFPIIDVCEMIQNILKDSGHFSRRFWHVFVHSIFFFWTYQACHAEIVTTGERVRSSLCAQDIRPCSIYKLCLKNQYYFLNWRTFTFRQNTLPGWWKRRHWFVLFARANVQRRT